MKGCTAAGRRLRVLLVALAAVALLGVVGGDKSLSQTGGVGLRGGSARPVAAAVGTRLRIGVCQTLVSSSKDESIRSATDAVKKAAADGAELCVLGEMWCCPYDVELFRDFADVDVPSELGATGEAYCARCPAFAAMSAVAKECKVWLVGGSIPEIESATNRVFNTCLTFDSNGVLVGKYRKIHLADTSVPTEGGSASVFESQVSGQRMCARSVYGARQGLMPSTCFHHPCPPRALQVLTPGDLGPCWVNTPWTTLGIGSVAHEPLVTCQ